MLASFQVCRRTLFAALFAASVPVSAHALERVTLRTGFTVECARHEIVGNHVRLYTGAGNDYQEISALQVASIESLPDAPKLIVLAQPAATPHSESMPWPGASQHLGTASPTSLQPVLDVRDLLIRAGAEHNIDVELLASVIQAESGYKVRAVSRAGARGLMQLMPATARSFGARDVFQADQNIAAGTAFLDEMLKRYHDNLALALAAYNAGPANVERYHGIPPFRETRAYVARVINEFYRRKIALGAVAASLAPAQAATSASSAAAAAAAKPVETASIKLASAYSTPPVH